MLGIAQLINEAWFHESNNDHEVALRLYKTAFNNILDINNQVNATNLGNIPSVSPFEIRSVADYLNHRTCHIQFLLNHPREAITQFRKYMDTFKQHTRSPDYAFEHSAWMSQQYLIFADLFNQAVTSGTKASKAQHPGYYYFEAASQMLEKRKYTSEYTNDEIRSNQMPVTNELLSKITANSFATFLRDCGWTCVNADNGPPVAPTSQQQQHCNQRISEPVNYSEIIMKALYRAIEHFEEWGRTRMVNLISVLIADEYCAKKNSAKALALYGKSLSAYEKERWTPLVDHIKSKLKTLDVLQ